MLPESLKTLLQDPLKKVKALHDRDSADGWGRVQMPTALDRKYPNAPTDWRWQWVFPQENRWINPQTKEQGAALRRKTSQGKRQKKEWMKNTYRRLPLNWG